jgi:hypothetical protein
MEFIRSTNTYFMKSKLIQLQWNFLMDMGRESQLALKLYTQTESNNLIVYTFQIIAIILLHLLARTVISITSNKFTFSSIQYNT